jgi:hypothetical protein
MKEQPKITVTFYLGEEMTRENFIDLLQLAITGNPDARKLLDEVIDSIED